MKFKITRDPYEEKVYIYSRASVEINPGITVLVGCNGAGKSTLIRHIKYNCEEQKLDYINFDNLIDGGHNARDKFAFHDRFDLLSTAICSSEGEELSMNIGIQLGRIGKKIRQMDDNKSLFIFFDASDSGLSIDNVIEIKSVFDDCVIPDAKNKGIDVYVIIAANEYEMTDGQDCIDVSTLSHVTFKTYDDYKKYIIKNRERKDKRYVKKENKN